MSTKFGFNSPVMSHASFSPSKLFSARRASAAVCLLSLALGAGCSAEAEIPEVVVTRSNVEFLGVPFYAGITDVSQELSTEFEHPSDVELPQDFNPELRPRSARIMASSESMENLSFLEGVTLTLASRAPDAPPPLVVASYERPPNGSAGREIELEVDPDSDVLSYWDTKAAYYTVTLRGVMPNEDWSVDVSFAFSGRLSI